MVSYFQARKNMRDEEVLYLLKKKNIYQHHKFIYCLAKNQAVLTLSLAIIYKELAYKKNNKNGKKNNKKF